ncbi:hypothetical protein [Wolbachia endosymbiont of Aedes albopictus]|uniref:hypothetical protein n=1 Tax=Wolbachia endosymbiont of Aedes albopictus TaxID=167957 RepID=UPI00216771C2|nr:hypothetical protein [Wolbachia endosymbiont of Aedes albopictus]UVW84385.1 hypothetical protein NHG98_02685 [Wolbachia endosymbiont of Aedes albopictus]
MFQKQYVKCYSRFCLEHKPSTVSLYNSVIRVAPFLSSQCLFLCHPSSPTSYRRGIS